jgi:hypothetical protein
MYLTAGTARVRFSLGKEEKSFVGGECGDWSISRCCWPSPAEVESARQASRRVIAKCSDQERTTTSLPPTFLSILTSSSMGALLQ